MDEQGRPQAANNSSMDEDELSRKLRDDTLIVAHLKSQGTVAPCQEGGTTVTTQKNRKPHRGGAILALGIFGLVLHVASVWGAVLDGGTLIAIFPPVAVICGIITWVMGSRDLRGMSTGMINPTGQGITRAGRLCGIVAVLLGTLALANCLLYRSLLFVPPNS